MRKGRRQISGFSLTEVLLAVGTLAVGMIFIAGLFPVGIHFTTVATERTMAAVVADEAFAKIRIIAAGPNTVGDPSAQFISAEDFSYTDSNSFEHVASQILGGRYYPNTFAYPSLDDVAPEEKTYFWSAICRRTGPSDVQATVFVCRRVGVVPSYYERNPANDALMQVAYAGYPNFPKAVYFRVSQVSARELEIIDNWAVDDGVDDETLINEGYMIVDDVTGEMYRVVARDTVDTAKILLDRPWQGAANQRIWAIPAAAGSGRYPCIAVYQRIIRF
jgi:hypothetical protein